MEDAKLAQKKVLIIIFSTIGVLCIAALIFYNVTYNNPIITGDSELVTEYKEVCLRYGRTLMGDFCGIRAHAQIINVRKEKGCVVILLTSIFPLSRTKVWHSDGDAPYWESGFHLH